MNMSQSRDIRHSTCLKYSDKKNRTKGFDPQSEGYHAGWR